MQHPKRLSALSAAVGTVALAVALVILPASSASADTGTIDGVTYTTSGTTATATAYSGSSATLVIPSTVTISSTVYTVTDIGHGAFDTLTSAPTDGHNTGTALTSVTLPSTVVTIEANAFARNDLTSIDIPDGVTDIQSNAFSSNNISSIGFPDGVTTIEDSAFFGNDLTSLVLPSTVTTLGQYAFSDNPIASLTLDDALTTIGDSAFQSEDYTTVTIPASVTSIGNYGFNTSTVTSAHFLGPKPTVGAHVFGDAGLPTVYYYWRYGDPQTVGGYTTPTWLANPADTAEAGPYTTNPIAIIHFSGNGGSTPADRTALVGDTVSDPSTSRSGHSFEGWFTAAAGGTKWDFADPVTGDLTLFAHWSSTAGLALTGIDPLPVLPVGVGALALGLVLWIVARRRQRGARA